LLRPARAPACFLAALLGSSAIVGPAFAQASNQVQEIVVTAQKREQSLQDVPISITALTGDALVANRVQDVRDISAVAPNLTVRPSGGGSQIPNFSMRGVVTGGTAAGTDKGISMYLDGVYMQAVQGSIMALADIERIEVLKGPQGTLFGRNATGGAISIITRNPSGSFGVRQELTYGNYNQFTSKTRIDLPKWGPFSAAFTYLHSEHRGDTKNLGAGTTWDYGPATGGAMGVRTSPQTLGDDNINAYAAAIRIDLHPDVDLMYKFDYSQNRFTPNAEGVSFLDRNATPAILPQLYAVNPGIMTPVTKTRPDSVNNWFTTPGYTRGSGHNFTATWRVTDNLTFKNILAYRSVTIDTTFQLDGLGGLRNVPITLAPGLALPVGVLPAPGAIPGGALNAPFNFLVNNSFTYEDQFSDEFQINYSNERLNLTMGFIHFQDHNLTAGYPSVFNTNIFTVMSGQRTPSNGTPFVIVGNPGYVDTEVNSDSNAFYMQPEIHVTDKLDVVAGIRFTRDHKRGVEVVPDPTAAIAAGIPVTSPIIYRDDHVSYLGGINYRFNPDVMAYVKYATGYISGGQLATIAFVPEEAESYEAGVKADLFDRRWRSNLAIFNVNYTKIQVTTSGTLTGVPSAFAFSQAVVPAADAKASGFEWENTVVPLGGLTLTANLGYTNFHWDQASVFPGFKAQSGLPGYLVSARPKWTANLAAQYDGPEIFRGGHFSARLDGNFRSKILNTTDVTTGSTLTSPEDPVLRDAATTGPQWILNGRVALVDMKVGSGRAQAALWGRNLFDNGNILQFVGLGPVGSVIYERARTFGIDLTFEY
jgi:iron complex outermembrane receptor protein